jgi:pantoate--beta-alanine ligase
MSEKLIIEKTVAGVKAQVKEWKKQGLTVGFVPTMGYLHEGHQSLIARAVEENDKVVVSVFVNPIQFGPTEDLESYPRDFNADCALCETTGASLVFHPEVSEMYGENFTTYVDTSGVTEELCGKSRPIHFRGVCTVVNKLFNIVNPDRAYFGKKDAQQLAVIRRMVRDLNMSVEIVGCPIIREADGLAKSSRNTYLSEAERQAALVLSKAVKAGEAMIQNGETNGDKVLAAMRAIIEQEPLARIDYIEMVKWDTIEVHHQVDGPVLVAMAVYIGKTRLIDNFIIE